MSETPSTTSEKPVKPFYDATQRQVLAGHFGEETIPLLEAAARVLEELKRHPPGQVEQCDQYRCTATRVWMLDADTNQMSWIYLDPSGTSGPKDQCFHRRGEVANHGWRTLSKRDSPF